MNYNTIKMENARGKVKVMRGVGVGVDGYGFAIKDVAWSLSGPPPIRATFSNLVLQGPLPDIYHTCYTQAIMTSKILTTIPADLLAQYQRFQISSRELGDLTGFHPAAIRRAVKRPPKPKQPKNKTALIQARKAFRATLAHLQPREIKELANVSLSTANRIRKMRNDV